MTVLQGKLTRIEVQQTLDAGKTITGITKASPAVVTATAHGYSNGDAVVMNDDILGMVELTGQIGRVASVTTNTFELESVNSTAYSTFTSGTVSKISAFSTLSIAQTFSQGGTGVNRLETTTLYDSEKQYVLGQSDTPEVTVDCLSDLSNTAFGLVKTAAKAGTALGFRVTDSNSGKRLVRGFVSKPSESFSTSAVVTASFSLTQIKDRMEYTT